MHSILAWVELPSLVRENGLKRLERVTLAAITWMLIP